jgi:hypothetical protein
MMLKNHMKMPKCQKKVSPAPAFYRQSTFFSLTSAFLHQGQSGTAGHGLVQHCPHCIDTIPKI